MNSLDVAVAALRDAALVYVISPYTGYRGGHDLACRNAAIATATLMSRGLVAFSPIAHSHTVAVAGSLDRRDPVLWQRQDRPYLGFADAAVVVKMAGWRESRGATAEIAAFVAAGKPVHFVEPAAVGIEDDPAAPPIIGLMGYGGVGKSTVARLLKERHGFEGPHIKGPIANMLRSLLRDLGYTPGYIEEFIDGEMKRELIDELGKTSTELQQLIGFDFGRDMIKPDIWLDIWLERVDGVRARGGRVVQESVRTAAEAERIRERGGIVVEVRRLGYSGSNTHRSEAIPAEPDGILENDGDIDALAVKVAELVR